MQLTPEMLAQIATLIQASKPKRKAKGKDAAAGRAKLTDEQKALNAKANATVAEKMFADAGYENCVAHETIRTYNKWVEAGRRVRKGEKSLRTPKGMALFHLNQTDAIAAKTN